MVVALLEEFVDLSVTVSKVDDGTAVEDVVIATDKITSVDVSVDFES